MLWSMFFITLGLLAAGAVLRDFIRKPNWWDAFWFVIFLCWGLFFQLALIGKVLDDVKVMNYV